MNTATLRSVALSAGAVIVGIVLFSAYRVGIRLYDAYSLGRQPVTEEQREALLRWQSTLLIQQTEAAAVMRSGDPSYALKLLERQIDLSDSVDRQSATEEQREGWLRSWQSASLMQQTKVAAAMRSGDPNYALELLEHQIDDGVLTIDHFAEQRTPPSFGKLELSAFKLAAIYRAKYQREILDYQKTRPQLVQKRIRFLLSLGDQQGQLTDSVFADKYLQPNSLQSIAPPLARPGDN